VLIIGHRGASAAYPENTLAAFAGAAAQGADGVELDLRRTADGGVVVRHDPTLPDGRRVVDLRRDQLPDWVPSLDDVLDACADFPLVNLEVKNWPDDPDFDPTEALAEQVVAALEVRPHARARVLVSSFHLPTIDRVRALDPALATGWLTLGMADVMAVLDRAAASGHRAVHPHVAFVDAAMVEWAHELGLQLNTWTVDDPARLRELADMGVDAAITNVPDVALAALQRGT
jgi:glycerophosphoryl diester phosphodiesterase